MKVLALETSTTSAKAMLYDTEENTFETVTQVYAHDYSRFDRKMQAEECYLQMLSVGRELIRSARTKSTGSTVGEKIGAIALIGVWHSLFLCRPDGELLSPVYHWNHTGAAALCSRIRKDEERTRRYYRTSGCMVNAIYPFFKIEMLRQMGMPVGDSLLLSQGAYNTWRMTGQLAATPCNASGDGLLDIQKREYNWDALQEMGVQRWQLPQLVPSETAYSLGEEAARILGICPGIPVLPANSDGGSNQIGAGAARKGVMTFSVGTSGAMRLTTEEANLPENPDIWCYLSPKGYLSGAATNGCCSCTDWARQKLFPPGTSYQKIEEGISDRETPPVFLPFLTGERCPGWDDDRMGGFVNTKISHTASDLYYAVQQGVLFNLYQCYQTLVKINPQPERIMLSGGILNSPSWTQMCADIFNKEMSVSNVDQGSLLGGIVMGMEAAGILKNAADYQPEIVRTIVPDEVRHEKYMEQYTKYLECYHANK